MIIFYTDKVSGNKAILASEEARHCVRVLRKRVGDEITFIDGQGLFYKGILETADPKSCNILVTESWEQQKKKYYVKMAVSLLKNPARFEWFVEKAVETGIDEIIPIICERTEKQNFKIQRIENIIISASKQTLKARFTKLKPMLDFRDIVLNHDSDQAFIPHLNAQSEYLGKLMEPSRSYTILIGPEGDFTDLEVKLALENGFIPASLGENRLRTETAAIVAGNIVNIINDINKE